MNLKHFLKHISPQLWSNNNGNEVSFMVLQTLLSLILKCFASMSKHSFTWAPWWGNTTIPIVHVANLRCKDEPKVTCVYEKEHVLFGLTYSCTVLLRIFLYRHFSYQYYFNSLISGDCRFSSAELTWKRCIALYKSCRKVVYYSQRGCTLQGADKQKIHCSSLLLTVSVATGCTDTFPDSSALHRKTGPFVVANSTLCMESSQGPSTSYELSGKLFLTGGKICQRKPNTHLNLASLYSHHSNNPKDT